MKERSSNMEGILLALELLKRRAEPKSPPMN